ncbi:MAG: Na/Pi cotransporter family protein, partial [Clostridia bacterium]|nr:Na/Pi cotransporter family protein [Clostridia bacterium]
MLEAILLLLAGVGVFIAGMNMLSSGLEQSAGGGLKKLLGKISSNRFAGVGVGAAVTAIIQSSSATSVMVIGFVNAGIMTLTQACAIIMGANIGTTVTGILVSLQSLPISDFVMLLAFVGVMMTFVKSERVKQLGGILCGFGLIFVGLELMGSSLKNSKEVNAFFVDLFQKINFPVLLILCGAVFTAVIQSSSAATGIFITMVGTGTLRLEDALFLVLGSNIGTCATALLACLGASVNAKRTAFMHFSVKTFGALVFMAFVWPFKDSVVELLQTCLPGNPQMQLAWFHVIFNVLNTLILIPFLKQVVKLSTIVIKDQPEKSGGMQLRFVDERLLKTPPVALMQVKKEVEYMASLAKENLAKSFEAMKDGASDLAAEIKGREKIINFTNHALTKYLIKLSALVDAKDEKTIGTYFHVLNDLERIGDHAENFHEIAAEMQGKDLRFSDSAKADLNEMQGKVMEMFEVATEAFDNVQTDRLLDLTDLENQVDGMKRSLAASHYTRLAEGNCKVELSPYFTSTIAGLERV